MAKASRLEEKFHNDNKQFITTKDEISADELEVYMKKCILNGDFQPYTKFILLAGVNHSKNKDGKVVLGGTDYGLLEEFEHKLFSNLYEIRDSTGNLIWDKMNFDDELVTLASFEDFNMKTFVSFYCLSDFSKRKLTQLAKDLQKEAQPVCIIFASSYSHESPILDFIKKEGLIDAIKGKKNEDKVEEILEEALEPTSFELDDKFRELLSSKRTIQDTTVYDKFHNENSNFITATVEINAYQLETHIKERILNRDFFPNTKFVVVAGSHHGLNYSGEVVPGMTDYKLLQGFEYKVFNNLYQIKDTEGNWIWEKMNFSYQLVTLACSTTDGEEFELSKRSERKLTKLAKDLCDQINPICVIFASCYSFQSPIKDFLIEKGVLAAIDISKDRGEISGGRIFAFDEDQKELNDHLREVLTFPSG